MRIQDMVTGIDYWHFNNFSPLLPLEIYGDKENLYFDTGAQRVNIVMVCFVS